MELLYAITLAVLTSCGVYLMLRAPFRWWSGWHC